MERRNFGLRIDPLDKRDIIFRTKTSRKTLPIKIDNSDYITPIKDQGPYGSCVGFTVVKAVEMKYWKKLLSRVDLSERWAYEKAKEYDEWPGTNYEGTSIRGALKAISKLGVCEEKYWPYNPNKRGKPSKEAPKNAKKYLIDKYMKVQGVDDMQVAIFRKRLVMCGAEIHEGWLDCKDGIIKYSPKNESLGGHAFLIVGYNQNGFIVVNSWGQKWGNKGKAIWSYQDAKLHTINAWTIDVNLPD